MMRNVRKYLVLVQSINKCVTRKTCYKLVRWCGAKFPTCLPSLLHYGKLSVEGEAPHRLIWRDEKGRVI